MYAVKAFMYVAADCKAERCSVEEEALYGSIEEREMGVHCLAVLIE